MSAYTDHLQNPGFQCKYRDMQTVPQVVHIHAGDQKGIITDDFCRKELIDLIPEFPLLINLCHITVTGCDICSGYPKMPMIITS